MPPAVEQGATAKIATDTAMAVVAGGLADTTWTSNARVVNLNPRTSSEARCGSYWTNHEPYSATPNLRSRDRVWWEFVPANARTLSGVTRRTGAGERRGVQIAGSFRIETLKEAALIWQGNCLMGIQPTSCYPMRQRCCGTGNRSHRSCPAK
jgi:hypothetical protein